MEFFGDDEVPYQPVDGGGTLEGGREEERRLRERKRGR
ncbi:uncharacterized protein G2W53_035825 [Senna tora]|uniref:Uncharacterized protein n=1 Tax=Senna tora TaxID=362788 RepID=A0A834SSG2_9FABA|nr:uncharacterized protein G2W53_035825 [Senna tora]